MRWLAYLRQRLRARPDQEHEMSFNRLGFAAIIVVVLLGRGGIEARSALSIMAVYFVLGFAVLTHILVYPRASPTRRLLALVLDTSFLSWQLHVGGETVASFFPIYLWITFGNGFRFGLPALRMGMLLTATGFAAVIATTSFWNQQSHLAIGLLVSLVVLPAYAGTLIRRLSKARSEAEQANEAKTLFLANVSHELRTPLTAVIGMGRMLHETPLDAEQREMTGTVLGAAQSLLSLIDDILQLSSLEAGRPPPEPVPFNLLEVLVSIRQLVIAAAHAKNLTVSLHVAPDVPQGLLGGERRLREILTNLASNAVKFTETGGVLIAVSARGHEDGRIKLVFEVADTGIGIAKDSQDRIFEAFTQADATIVDRFGGTGLGLAISRRLAESLGGTLQLESTVGRGSVFRLALSMEPSAETVARPVAGMPVRVMAGHGPEADGVLSRLAAIPAVVLRLDPSRHGLSDQDGTVAEPGPRPVMVVCTDGLGWSGDRLLAELRGIAGPVGPQVVLVGAMPPGIGAELRWLCCSIVPTPARTDHILAALVIASARAGQTRDEPVAQTARRLRILVAEDNRVNQMVLRKMLEKAGHETTLVGDGEAALDALEEDRFDIVLMDVNMPRMDGLDATKMYRFMALDLPRVPIVGLTADASQQMNRRCLDAGMDTCITKPFEPTRLLDLVQQLTGAGSPPAPDQRIVTHIVSHPRFRPAAGVVLDEETLETLSKLGGEDFLEELVSEFRKEAGTLVAALASSLHQQDVSATYTHAHTLQSISANIGARALAELCRSWQGLDTAQVLIQGPEMARQAAVDLARVVDAFTRRQGLPRRATGLSS